MGAVGCPVCWMAMNPDARRHKGNESMEHAEAVKLNAVEKYVLGEFTPSEREAFEEHYFDCADCAADIKAAAVFVDNARDLMRPAPQAEAVPVQREQRRGWFVWLQPSYAMGA